MVNIAHSDSLYSHISDKIEFGLNVSELVKATLLSIFLAWIKSEGEHKSISHIYCWLPSEMRVKSIFSVWSDNEQGDKSYC